MSNKTELDIQLEEKYKQITKLVTEYNDLARAHKHVSRVGSIITPGEKCDDEDYQDDYSTSGWVPSSLGC